MISCDHTLQGHDLLLALAWYGFAIAPTVRAFSDAVDHRHRRVNVVQHTSQGALFVTGIEARCENTHQIC